MCTWAIMRMRVFISIYASCSFNDISPVTWKKTLQVNVLLQLLYL